MPTQNKYSPVAGGVFTVRMDSMTEWTEKLPFKVNDLAWLLSACFFGGAGMTLKQEESGKDGGIASHAGNRYRGKFERQQDGSKVDQGVQAHSGEISDQDVSSAFVKSVGGDGC